MRSLTNRQLLVGGFALAGVATLASFLILVGGLADGRRARALESTVDELRGQLRDVRQAPASATLGADPRAGADGGHAAIAAIARRLHEGLLQTLEALPGRDVDFAMRVVPAEGVRRLVDDLTRHVDLAALLYEQSRALAGGAPLAGGEQGADGDGG